MIKATPADVGRLVSYTGYSPSETGRISSVRERPDGEYDVWVRYGRSTTGALTPTDQLVWG